MKKVKRILFFVPSVDVGGVEKVMIDYANLLCNRYEVLYIAMKPISEIGGFRNMISDKISFHSLNVYHIRHSILPLRKYIKQSDPDIVLTANNHVFPVVINKIILYHKHKFKVVTSQHNLSKNAEIVRPWLSICILKLCSMLCYKIISISQSVTVDLITNLKISPKKIATIYNPIDRGKIIKLSNESKVDNKNEYILYVGRLTSVKNVPLLINAFKIFSSNNPDIDLLIIGDGVELIEIKDLVESLSLNQKIKFIGSKSNPYPYIKNAKVIAIPSLSEGLSLVCLEGLTLGKTIVSTPNEGCKELLFRNNERYGYISKSFDDPLEFANILETACANPLPSIKLSESTIMFDGSNVVKEIISIWGD